VSKLSSSGSYPSADACPSTDGDARFRRGGCPRYKEKPESFAQVFFILRSSLNITIKGASAGLGLEALKTIQGFGKSGIDLFLVKGYILSLFTKKTCRMYLLKSYFANFENKLT
jgi:hypothetical protein